MRNLAEITSLLQEKYNLKSETKVAQALGMTQQTFSAYKKRGTIPYQEIIAFCHKKKLSLDWIFLGREPEKPASPSDLERRIEELEKIIKK
ncbi:MAG: hypothetical protein ACD_59C00053G0004 [uncultured bacterium]|nr:MAG: hypothetical protein ACD_59C00053G0004 [uncultured bacterium]